MSESDFAQLPFDLAEFADNPEPRCPVVILLDNSGSMQGSKIRQLNEGMKAFQDDLARDSLAVTRCEIAIVSFGPVRTVMDFTTAQHFVAPELKAEQATPLGAAVLQGLDMLKRRKEVIRRGGLAIYRPWVILITDGVPTDDWQKAAEAIKQGQDNKSFAFFPIGVEGADLNILRQLSHTEPLMLKGLDFRSMFLWLSASLKSVSQSTPGDKIKLASPKGWAEI